MSSIDDRIVSMKFDNVAFQKNIGDTLKSLDKLRQSLDFTNSTRGMNELSSAGKSFNMAGMATAVESVSGKFLALTTIGITALATITSHAITAAGRFAKAFTFAPVISGFDEYETQLNSVQTILANTAAAGTTMEQVNAALSELNEYSDKTIYNFGQMAKNIGTFTAAGVDLDTSVGAIKGIANLSALSGSNAEQASSAMYQLSQAISTGTLRLIDWNSVTNAGIGGEVFKNALFETGKAMGALGDVPMEQTFAEWEAANGSFRASLEKDWVTSDVLTTALSTFTGDMTDAELAAAGFSEAQIVNIKKVAETAVGAATQVKTFTQLMGTVKEAIGTGWSDSFKLVIGNFEEAKETWTRVNDAIGSVVSASAAARNELLQGWKDLGGRDLLIQGLTDAVSSLGTILTPIKEAFREIFPRTTAQTLFELTERFANFAKSLAVGGETAEKIKSIFSGFFAVIEIGWTIFKEIIGLIGSVIGSLSGLGSGLLSFSANTGDMLTSLNEALVAGGGIHDFFARLRDVIRTPIEFIQDLTRSIIEFFMVGFRGGENASRTLGNLEDNFGSLSGISDRLASAFGRLGQVFEGFKNILSELWDYISSFFSELGSKIAEAMGPEDFDAAVDVVNVGLLGGIALLLRRFISGGITLDFGSGILAQVSGVLEGLTGTLQAMQANVQADTLMKIAIAVGVLTASVLILSMINSADLTSALLAMSVGFGQMVGVMTLLTAVTAGPMGAVKITILAGALILLASSMVVLSIAVKNLSSLSWEELAKGLVGIAVGLGVMVAAMRALPPTPGLIASGIAMTAISVALLLLSTAVKSFAEMSWSEMAKGLVAIGVGLGIIITAMQFLPTNIFISSVALIAVAVSLRILAEAVQAFGDIGWVEITKGLIGIGAALVIIASAMTLMPPGMIVTASGLLVLSVALNVMAKAVKAMGAIKLVDLIKGLGGLAAMLAILSVALIVMQGTLGGSAALLVASNAILVLSIALKVLGSMNIGQIVTGLGALAGVFIVLGAAGYLLAPLIPVLMGLGVALALMGGAMALVGVGAYLVAKAFEAMARAGQAGMGALIEVIKMFIGALPEFVGAFVRAIVQLASELLTAAPLLLNLVTVLLTEILNAVIILVPKIAETISSFIDAAIILMRAKFPVLLETGFLLLMELLRGIRDNIGQVSILFIEIIINIVNTIIANAFRIVDAGINLLLSFLGAIASRASDITQAGLNLLLSFIQGIADNVFMIIDVVGNIITTFITTLSSKYGEIINAGINAIISFITGIGSNLNRVITTATDVIITFVDGLGANAQRLVDAAFNTLITFLNGLAESIRENAPLLRDAGWNIATAIVGGITGGIGDAAGGVASGLIGMAGDGIGAVSSFLGIGSPSKKFIEIGKRMVEGIVYALHNDNTAKNSAVEHAEGIINAFQTSLNRIPDSLAGMEEFNPVITPVLDLTRVQSASRNISGYMNVPDIMAEVSLNKANLISKTTELDSTPPEVPTYTGPSEVKFEQNIYAPSALSTNDIYRNTKSQIALAKEELNIP